MEPDIVNLAEVPHEILEAVVSKLTQDEINMQLSVVCDRIKEESYGVVLTEFEGFKRRLDSAIQKFKKELRKKFCEVGSLQEGLSLVTRLGYLQVLEAEYRLIGAVLAQKESLMCTVLPLKSIKCLDGFHLALDGWWSPSWERALGSSVLGAQLPAAATALVLDFIWKYWNMYKNPLGPFIIKILCSGLSSNFDLAVSHVDPVYTSDITCCIKGKYELTDYSRSLRTPCWKSEDPELSVRELVTYLWAGVRWTNSFHLLRMRWNGINGAEVEGPEKNFQWSPFSQNDIYLNNGWNFNTTSQIAKGKKIVQTIIRKPGEDILEDTPWLGIKCEFKLMCPLYLVPKEFFNPQDYRSYSLLPRSMKDCRYHYKMEISILTICKKTLIENVVNIDEESGKISISRESRNLNEK